MMDKLTTLFSQASDYHLARFMIAEMATIPANENGREKFARNHGFDLDALAPLFRRWAGVTPEDFAQHMTIDRNRHALREHLIPGNAGDKQDFPRASSPHGPIITYEQVSPEICRTRGKGLDIGYGFHPSPFGNALVMVTGHGLTGLAFCDREEREKDAALLDMQQRWPEAHYHAGNPAETARWATRIFDPSGWTDRDPLRIGLIGTEFELQVWAVLLRIGLGQVTTYSDIAAVLDKPAAARAVGSAVGRNPISFVVPCHRVIGKNAGLRGYRWGVARKQAMLGWEAAFISCAGTTTAGPEKYASVG